MHLSGIYKWLLSDGTNHWLRKRPFFTFIVSFRETTLPTEWQGEFFGGGSVTFLVNDLAHEFGLHLHISPFDGSRLSAKRDP